VWIDEVNEADTPKQIALALLATDANEMRDLTGGVDYHRLVNLSARLTTLMLGLGELPEREPLSAEDFVWVALVGENSRWPLYSPSVLAGAFGLSCALKAAFTEGILDAVSVHLATDPLEMLPRGWEPERYQGGSEAFVLALRTYMLVPLVSEIRFVWLALTILRDEREHASKLVPKASSTFRQAWTRLTEGTDVVDDSALMRGLVLRQVVPFIDAFAREKPPQALDFSDLPALAAHTTPARSRESPQLVAGTFQRRLTALFRSFNGRVVEATPGQPLGDIYYELPGGDFVLIDAKSTGSSRGYTLPRGDADAIHRYVSDATKLLPRGRSVVAVLIVGPTPGAALDERLLTLEGSVGCLVRFARADQVLSFRDAYPGGTLLGFTDALRKCPGVLPDNWWQPIVERAQADNERLQEYVHQGLRL
jgi:hypothetical protein